MMDLARQLQSFRPSPGRQLRSSRRAVHQFLILDYATSHSHTLKRAAVEPRGVVSSW